MNRTTPQTCAPFARRLRRSLNRLIMLDFDVGPVLAPVRCRPPCILFALSKRTGVYVSAACQQSDQRPREIGSSPSFVGSAGATRRRGKRYIYRRISK
ncbi:hypothetical protein BSFP_057840 [Burkholderia stabilis]|uniref:Uncharacterized protein n=1 Tax=Burkholderia stabilis TaxID=95485 RepID=A0A1Y1BUZ3_9BURK|nr:hypothetical protein BSFP_057840 [Burkholderia stabilis]